MQTPLKGIRILEVASHVFVPIAGGASTLAQGTTPIVIRWDYLALGDRDTLAGNPDVAVVVPKTGIVAGVYVQAISAYAPHPNAAKLWMEHLYGDESQLTWLKGYCHPIRFNDLVKNGKVPAELMAKLPPADNYGASPTFDATGELMMRTSRQSVAIWDATTGDELVFGLDLLEDALNGRILPDGRLEIAQREPALVDIPRDTRPAAALVRDIDCKVPLEVVGSRIQPRTPTCQ